MENTAVYQQQLTGHAAQQNYSGIGIDSLG